MRFRGPVALPVLPIRPAAHGVSLPQWQSPDLASVSWRCGLSRRSGSSVAYWNTPSIPVCGLSPVALVGIRDAFGGVLVPLYQSSFGHRAPKATALYLVGLPVPEIPEPRPTSTVVERMGRPERERTPPEMAAWLVDLVRSVQ